METAKEPLKIVPARTDVEMADAYRRELAIHLDAVCGILNRARSDGLTVNFNIAPDPYGRNTVTVHIVKAL